MQAQEGESVCNLGWVIPINAFRDHQLVELKAIFRQSKVFAGRPNVMHLHGPLVMQQIA